jgi:hypothetical protein
MQHLLHVIELIYLNDFESASDYLSTNGVRIRVACNTDGFPAIGR